MHAALLAAQEQVSHSAVPPVGVGLATFGALVALLLVTYAFRNVGNRH